MTWLRNFLKEALLGYTGNTSSFSQAGEDLILRSLLTKRDGFYVDIGAYHPISGSNTFFFYKFLNWKGINIDAMPGSMEPFKKKRPRDINLQVGISDHEQPLSYYSFRGMANMNTFDVNIGEERKKNGLEVEILKIETLPLSKILERYGSSNGIDLLTIDVEGYEYNVLKSNNWEKFRPSVILIEEDKSELFKSRSIDLLVRHGYELVAITPLGMDYINTTTNLYFVDGHKYAIKQSMNSLVAQA